MLKVENGKIYATQEIQHGQIVFEDTWLESTQKKSFYIPNPHPVLGNKDALLAEDLFLSVEPIREAKYIQASKKANTDLYIDRNKQKLIFVACKKIKVNDEITYTYHPSCFSDVKIQ